MNIVVVGGYCESVMLSSAAADQFITDNRMQSASTDRMRERRVKKEEREQKGKKGRMLILFTREQSTPLSSLSGPVTPKVLHPY